MILQLSLQNPQFVILNNRPYEAGQTIHGHPDLELISLDSDFAHFEYLGEKVKLALPKIFSRSSGGSTKGTKPVR